MTGKSIHRYGTDDGWHGIIEEGGEFPPEKDRYHLYIGTHPIAINCRFKVANGEFVHFQRFSKPSTNIHEASSAPSPTA